jgi:putative ABC transport system permease protein
MNFQRYQSKVETVQDAATGESVEIIKHQRPEGLEVIELDVIGVYDSDQFGLLGSQLHVPIPLARDLLEESPLFAMGLEEGEHRAALVKVLDHSDLDKVREAIEKKGFETQTIFDVLQVIRYVFIVFEVLLSFFGGIGLFVAFFGIANTMVMAVLERIREIGVLKALGARDREIRRIFLMEAAAIGLTGGLLGVFVGWSAGIILNWIAKGIAQAMAPSADLGSLELFYVPLWLALISLGVSTAVAMVAGIYPAWRAARQDPVVALRRE